MHKKLLLDIFYILIFSRALMNFLGQNFGFFLGEGFFFLGWNFPVFFSGTIFASRADFKIFSRVVFELLGQKSEKFLGRKMFFLG